MPAVLGSIRRSPLSPSPSARKGRKDPGSLRCLGLRVVVAAPDAYEEGATQAVAPKPAIVVTSFGTSYASSRHATIGAIESDIREAYPDYDVRRAFTAQIIIDHIEKDTGRHIDNFEEAMDKLVAEGVKEVIVQPTHLMDGFEYNDIKNSLENYAPSFDKCVLGAPLLASEADQIAVAKAIKEAMERYEDEKTAICLMGHGTEAESNAIYATMQKVFDDLGYDNYFVATVEATPTFDDVAKAAKEAGYTKAVLRPMMVVAGDHANNDMADTEDPESFASVMTAAGFEVTSRDRGPGPDRQIDEIYVATCRTPSTACRRLCATPSSGGFAMHTSEGMDVMTDANEYAGCRRRAGALALGFAVGFGAGCGNAPMP